MAATDEIQSSSGMNVRLSLGVTGRIEDHPLEVIAGIREGIRSLEPTLRQAVSIARQQRFTWEEIGNALGVTRQSAWERFGTD